MDWRDALREALQAMPDARLVEGARGGWTTGWTLQDGARRWFVKTAILRHAPLLDAEVDGLRALRETGAVRVPDVVAQGASGTVHWLALEWLELRPPAATGAALGAALAALHRAPPPLDSGGRYGWHVDNYIGATAQGNGWCTSWIEFWRDRRLAPQLARAAENGYGGALQAAGERLVSSLGALLAGHDPMPSLLHGDLWSGNAGALQDGPPVLFDPAVYVGDRECDVAMTELFGGFGRDFQAAYRDAWPLDARYPLRREVYNAYHLLNHLNLFGESYLARCEQAIGRLAAQA